MTSRVDQKLPHILSVKVIKSQIGRLSHLKFENDFLPRGVNFDPPPLIRIRLIIPRGAFESPKSFWRETQSNDPKSRKK